MTFCFKHITDTLNSRLNALKETLNCSKENAKNSVILSLSVSLVTDVSGLSLLMLVPGANLLAAGCLIGSSVVANAVMVTNHYYWIHFGKLVERVRGFQAKVDGQRKEMTAIKGRIDGMLLRASARATTKDGQEGHVHSEEDIYDNSEFDE